MRKYLITNIAYTGSVPSWYPKSFAVVVPVGQTLTYAVELKAACLAGEGRAGKDLSSFDSKKIT